MSQAIRAAATLLVLAASLSAAEFGGTIHDDPPALALPMHFTPAAGVTVRLYADDGDRIPTATDRLAETTRTDAAGRYRFTVAAGAYWIAVDSRSIRPNAWAEQTYGPAGALCAQQDGSARVNYFAGSCFGGRFAAASDNAASLLTADHVALVSSPATDLDFAFSVNAVTTIDDDGQGSLRQFLRNANAIAGPNAMRFVPLSRPKTRWWTIQLTTPLPAIEDITVIDGTARNFLSAATAIDTNPGRFGELPHVTAGESVPESRQSRPELEIVTTGDEGITCNAHCTVRHLALHGARVAIVTRADSLVEEVIIGARPDVVPIIAPGDAGLQVEKGTTAARLLYVTRQRVAGIAAAAPGARVEGERLTITRCGTPTSGAAVALISDRSTIRLSDITGNDGAGIILGTPDGTRPAHENTIEGNTISGNLAGVVLTPGASRNRIEKNDIVWNRNGGVVNAAPPGSTAPTENRISANRFNENGARPIDLTRGTPPADVMCDRVDTAPNRGIAPPVVESARIAEDRVHIRGRACPGQLVEIYQSYMTSETRGLTVSLRESDRRTLPSVGEFNYAATTTTRPDGSFELSLPHLRPPAERTSAASSAEAVAWSETASFETDPMSRAYSALAIDAQGNTSELGGRRGIE